jgi:hypothetical protein
LRIWPPKRLRCTRTASRTPTKRTLKTSDYLFTRLEEREEILRAATQDPGVAAWGRFASRLRESGVPPGVGDQVNGQVTRRATEALERKANALVKRVESHESPLGQRWRFWSAPRIQLAP